MFSRSLLGSTFHSRVAFMAADVGTPGIGDNSKVIPDQTAKAQKTVWDASELEQKVSALMPDLLAVQNGGETVTAKLSVYLAEYGRRIAVGYIEHKDGAMVPHEPKTPNAEELRKFARHALKLDSLNINMGNAEQTRIKARPSAINQIVGVAARAGALAALSAMSKGANGDGVTIAWFAFPPNARYGVAVAEGTKDAVQRIAAPWGKVEPNMAFQKGSIPNPKPDVLIPLGTQQINTSYSACIDKKPRDEFGKLLRGADENRGETLGTFLAEVLETLTTFTNDVEGMVVLHGQKDKIKILSDLLDELHTATAEEDAADAWEMFKQRRATAEAVKAGGKGNGNRKAG